MNFEVLKKLVGMLSPILRSVNLYAKYLSSLSNRSFKSAQPLLNGSDSSELIRTLFVFDFEHKTDLTESLTDAIVLPSFNCFRRFYLSIFWPD